MEVDEQRYLDCMLTPPRRSLDIEFHMDGRYMNLEEM